MIEKRKVNQDSLAEQEYIYYILNCLYIIYKEKEERKIQQATGRQNRTRLYQLLLLNKNIYPIYTIGIVIERQTERYQGLAEHEYIHII